MSSAYACHLCGSRENVRLLDGCWPICPKCRYALAPHDQGRVRLTTADVIDALSLGVVRGKTAADILEKLARGL